MSEAGTSTTDDYGPGLYEIRVKGHLDQRWAERLEGLTLTLESNGITSISGQLTDQAALHGVLNRVRDLGLTMISVERLSPTGKAIGEENS
jgi:hypothetical protein